MIMTSQSPVEFLVPVYFLRCLVPFGLLQSQNPGICCDYSFIISSVCSYISLSDVICSYRL